MVGSVPGLSPLESEEALRILAVLCLSALVGLEREGRKEPTHYVFGGVRTFPLIGFLGYGLTRLSGGQFFASAVGLVVVGAFLLVSYRHKLQFDAKAGLTTELAGLVTYLLGAMVASGLLWLAGTLVVLSALLLELKSGLEKLTERVPAEEIATFTKFLLLTIVILPAVPNHDFTPFHINPFKTWLVVVAVSSVSYGSYVLSRVTQSKGGIVLAAVLGGAYSSTVTTVVLARRARVESHPNLFAGSMLIACGMMYLRLTALLAFFSDTLFSALYRPFLGLAGAALLGGFLWTRIPDGVGEAPRRSDAPRNPLELRSAFVFALMFLAMLVGTRFAAQSFGAAGIFGLAAVMGVADVDPFIMGLAQTVGVSTPVAIASIAIVLTVATNNLAKGCYALAFADRPTGVRGLIALLGLAVAGLAPILLFV